MVSEYGYANSKKATMRVLNCMPSQTDIIKVKKDLSLAEERRLVNIAIKDLKAGSIVTLPEKAIT